MAYVEQSSVDAGIRFKSPSGILVETTGNTVHIPAHEMYVHEVVIVDGVGKGEKFLLNLDSSTPE